MFREDERYRCPSTDGGDIVKCGACKIWFQALLSRVVSGQFWHGIEFRTLFRCDTHMPRVFGLRERGDK